MEKNELLEEYKKFDYLNKEKNNPLLKILVSYIKPSFLFQSEILTPVHLGRAIAKQPSKEGAVSENDLLWLYKHCLGDDDFEGNISYINRRIGFFTGTYWAWKNYEKLGNPKYFGSFGYRRLFNPAFLQNLQEYDCVIPYRVDYSKTDATMNDHLDKFCGENFCRILYTLVNKIYPEEIENFKAYLNSSAAFMYELYVMKKEVFFEFCEWIYVLLEEFMKMPQIQFRQNSSLLSEYYEYVKEERDIAFAMEILTGYYCYKLITNKNIKTKQESMVYFPAEKNSATNKAVMNLLRNKFITKNK